ncbi:hypothetical protein Gogos_000902, partial [Gossypium gossypioides]|nr:hypothetical protein [Gossypium gossypioides]
MIGTGPKKGFKALKPTNGKLNFKTIDDQTAFDDGSKMGAKMGVDHELSVQPVNIGNGQHDKPPDIVVNGFSNDRVNLEATMKGLVYGPEQGLNGAPMEDDVPFVEEIMDGESDGGDKVEANRFASGIWLYWNENILVDILEIHCYMIHLRIRSKQGPDSFICSAVYASPHST